MQQWQHCKLTGGTITYLDAYGLLADKLDHHLSETKAWEELGENGWELVSTIINSDGGLTYFFKRPRADK